MDDGAGPRARLARGQGARALAAAEGAVIVRARSRYSSFRWSWQNSSVNATTASYVACIAFGTEIERGAFTLSASCRRMGRFHPNVLPHRATRKRQSGVSAAIKARLAPRHSWL